MCRHLAVRFPLFTPNIGARICQTYSRYAMSYTLLRSIYICSNMCLFGPLSFFRSIFFISIMVDGFFFVRSFSVLLFCLHGISYFTLVRWITFRWCSFVMRSFNVASLHLTIQSDQIVPRFRPQICIEIAFDNFQSDTW